MKPEFDRAAIERVVAAVADRLEGDWLLIGGALVALWLEPRRVTEDIDLVAVGGTADARLRLMQVASDLGLPIEAVNSAADFFVQRIAGWEREVEIFRQGTRGRILRPTPTLFLLLKSRRLSERDLEDCAALIRLAREAGLALDADRVRAGVRALPPASDPNLANRRRELLDALA